VTTAETIERAQIRDLRDMQTVVPSLSVGQRQIAANTNFFIRGFGNGANNAGIEPSVGVFVDNVYRSRTAAQITDLPDVQHIEVLRGPQSTLFGKNASAGVISDHHRGAWRSSSAARPSCLRQLRPVHRQGPRHRPLTDSAARALPAEPRDGLRDEVPATDQRATGLRAPVALR
jgi:hypothetical protein